MTPTQCGKPICSICYEDLNPIAEDLQSITVCGHVFHELCIQQWLEYIPAGKKPTCPVCKQSFSSAALLRLYFQSSGEAPHHTAKPLHDDGEVERLRDEAGKLQGKLNVIGSAFESQKKRVEELTREVSSWRERASGEEAAKEAVRVEKDRIGLMLRRKQEELSTTSEECSRLRERSLALAKELAALKLATDVNLEEEEVIKLASFANGTKVNDAADVLKKSLLLRNKSYKELMMQCNLLGRSENRALKKLEKAEEKIKKLKGRLQEFAKALEEKDNEILRVLKSSLKKGTQNVPVLDPLDGTTFLADVRHSHDFGAQLNGFSCSGTSLQDITNSEHKSQVEPGFAGKMIDAGNDAPISNASFLFKKYTVDSHSGLLKPSTRTLGHQNPVSRHVSFPVQQTNIFEAFVPPASEKATKECVASGEGCPQLSGSILNVNQDLNLMELGPITSNKMASPAVVCIDDDFENNVSIANHNQAVDDDIDDFSVLPSFSGGLLMSNGKRHPGKWSSRATISPTMETSTPPGSLIAVGADGRGGKIKVIRNPSQHLDKPQGLQTKRLKIETKQVAPSKGYLQIEHFFGKQGH